MYVDKLALRNYRNYEKAEIEFSHGINILYGDNAQGKTNILEALYLVATTKSHRGAKDKEIIRTVGPKSNTVSNICQELGIPNTSFPRYRERLMKKGVIYTPERGVVELALPRFAEVIALY
jgi:recombinational DNA repair ATPase RecF